MPVPFDSASLRSGRTELADFPHLAVRAERTHDRFPGCFNKRYYRRRGLTSKTPDQDNRGSQAGNDNNALTAQDRGLAQWSNRSCHSARCISSATRSEEEFGCWRARSQNMTNENGSHFPPVRNSASGGRAMISSAAWHNSVFVVWRV